MGFKFSLPRDLAKKPDVAGTHGTCGADGVQRAAAARMRAARGLGHRRRTLGGSLTPLHPQFTQ